MDYKLELKPATPKNGQKYKVIQITDIALHTGKKTPTPSVGKKMRQAFTAGKPDRVYSPLKKPDTADSRTFIIELFKQDPDFMAFVREEEAKGYKVLLSLPKDGIPVVPGKDTVEFIHSKKGKRVLRRLAKEKHGG